MRLQIKESSWSGWSKDDKPEEREMLYDLRLQEKYIIRTSKISYSEAGKIVEEEMEVFSFYIVEIHSDYIKIKTCQPFSDNENGTINLKSDKTEFTVQCDKVLKLVTPTMDRGYTYYLRLV